MDISDLQIINIGKDSLRVEFPPKNIKVRNEFLDESIKERSIYEDSALKYKDPEETKHYIRNKIREMNYNILHGELDHWDIQFGKGPIFRQVDSKLFVLSFKGEKIHESSEILGSVVMGIGVVLLGINMLLPYQGLLEFLIRFIFGLFVSGCFFYLGMWIARPLTLWIKGTGVAYRVKGQSIFSDQYFQFSAACGFQGMGKIDTLRDDFDKIFKEIIEFLGEVKEK